MKTQSGGTILGLIIGLLVGLAVALAVAVYVTKVPVPLVDRGVTRKPDQDAIEKERNKDWNPNAGLGSKTVPTPSAAEPAANPDSNPAPSAPTPPAPAEPSPVTKSAPTPATAKPATSGGKSTDPLGDLIQSRTKEAPVAEKSVNTEAGADPFVYFVQAGAFRNADEAEGQRAKLAMLGFDVKVTEREQAGKPVFRVRVGPFNKKVEADIMQERLKGQSIDTALVRVQR